ncbi:MBOAT family O-acyltransferase [Magnetococcus sp. PR-3]|uniref:MBOAT family O-acyltransferase n=1 Tax=Magnetococcus sp. PR-3 TaxID=3120355 RepID=UPI002FCE0EA1
MVFSSHIFLLAFLPTVLVLFYLLGRLGGQSAAITWLAFASLFFYGWWNPIYLLLIGVSILFNYVVALSLCQNWLRDDGRMPLLVGGLLGNLALLGYFKYTNFFIDNFNAVTGVGVQVVPIILPLAISFFTFQQVAYLVDAFQFKKAEPHFIRYTLFVSFFPQLIAGPIVHHKEMLPQFESARTFRFQPDIFALGISILILGLAKKVLLADNLALLANPVFDSVAHGGSISTLTAWVGGVAYTFQLYFDFSGYSEMAIGLALMFGIRLPINFNAPFKASSMLEFWRRWHMTLSRFLQEYLFMPLSMKEVRMNLWTMPLMSFIITMLFGGLWHGAQWTFVAWGLFHGVLLAINQSWRNWKKRRGWSKRDGWWNHSLLGVPLTFLCVLASLVVFRSADLGTAGQMYQAMLGFGGKDAVETSSVALAAWPWLSAAAILVWWAPNLVQLMRDHQIVTDTLKIPPHWLQKGKSPFLLWRPSLFWGVVLSVLAFLSVLRMNEVNEFLYFQF